MSRRALAATLLTGLIASTAHAGDRIEFDFGGMVQYDLRFRVKDYVYGAPYLDVPDLPTLSRNELIGRFKLNARIGRFGMKSELDFVLRAYPRVEELGDLYLYNNVTPFRFEAHSLYLYARDLLVPGFDLSIGQQKAMFGVGDQFNPTNTVNPWDFEDPLLFGDQIGNLMVRMDYSPAWNWQLTGILVPVFKPALLPRSGYLAQTPERYPFLNDELRHNLIAEQASGEQIFGYPTVVNDVAIQQPEFHPKNFQGFFRVGAVLGGQDIALSYYRGRSDIPQPIRNVTSQVEFDQPICNTSWTGRETCTRGVLASDVTLAYPRQHVFGFNMAGEFDAFGWMHKSFKPLGYRLEVAVILPEDETRLTVIQDDVQFAFVTRDGEYPYPDGDNRVQSKAPFAKWVLGLDYTFNKHVYMNTQWVHGFPDEWGAGDFIQEGWTTRAAGIRPGIPGLGNECLDVASFAGQGTSCAREWLRPKLGDYLVVGLDFRFLSNSALLRLFAIWDLIGVFEETFVPDGQGGGERVRIHHSPFTREGFNMVLYPSFEYNFGKGFDAQLGALLMLGERWTKFGAPENGGHQIWTRARYRF